MNKIITIDVGNIPSNKVEEYMEECIAKMKGILYVPPSKLTRYQRFKKWLYDVCDLLGIAGSFGGFN